MASSSGSDAIRYDLNSDSRVFMCRHCQNHVLSSDNFLAAIVSPGTRRIFYCKPVNVRVKLATSPWSRCKLSIRQPPTRPASVFHPSAMINVLCKQCDKLPWREISYGPSGWSWIAPAAYRVEHRTKVYVESGELLYWDGSRLTYADTLKPVCNNE